MEELNRAGCLQTLRRRRAGARLSSRQSNDSRRGWKRLYSRRCTSTASLPLRSFAEPSATVCS